MATTYRLDSLDSDLSGGADFSKALLQSGHTTGSLTFSIAAASTETSYGYTEPLDPGADGTSTGTFTVEIDFTTTNANIYASVSLSRIDSSGVLRGTSSATAEQQTPAAGVYTFTLTNPILGAWSAGDRLRVNYTLRNISGLATTSVTLALGGANTEVSVPWTYVPPPPGGNQYVKQSGIWKKYTPFVRDAGVWKQVNQYVKQSGIWKKV